MEALLLIDLQEDFLDAPGLAEQRARLAAGADAWAAWALGAGLPVVEVGTVVPRDPATWALNMRQDDQPVALEGTPGVQRLAELTYTPTHRVTKTRDDAFVGTDLAALLRSLDVDRLVVGGIETHACVALTAAGAYARDVRVSLAEEALGAADPEGHRAALRWMADQYRQPLVSLGDRI